MTRTHILFTFLAVFCFSIPGLIRAQNASDLISYSGTVHYAPQSFLELLDVSDVSLTKGQHVIGTFLIRDADIDGEVGRLFNSTLEQFSYSLGYFHEFDSFQIGVLANLNEIEVSGLPAEGNSNNFETINEGSGYNLAVSGSKEWGAWRLVLMGAFGDIGFDGNREFTTTPNLPKTASFDLSSYSLQARLSYQIVSGDNWTVAPFLTLGYIQSEADGFSEVDVSGNAGDEADVRDFEDTLTYAEGGIDVRYVGYDRVEPGLRLRVLQDLGDDSIEYVYSIGPFTPFTATIPDPDQTRFMADAFLDFKMSENFSLEARVSLDSGDSSSGFGGGILLRYLFD